MLSQSIARTTCQMQSTFENQRESYKLNYVEVEIGPPKQGRDDGNPVIRIQPTSTNVNYSTIVFHPKLQNIALKDNSSEESTNNNVMTQTSSCQTNAATSKPNQSKLPNVVSTNGPLSPPPTKVVSSSPPSSPLPHKSATPTKKSILAGILPSLPSKFSGVKFSRSKNQAKNNAAANKETSKMSSNSKSSPKKTAGVSIPIVIAGQTNTKVNNELVSVDATECTNTNYKKILLTSSPELSPQPRLRKRQSVERRGRGRRQALTDTASCSSSEGPTPSPEIVRKELLKARPNTLEINDEDGSTVSENLQVSPEGSAPRRRALSTPTRGHQMLINESELADAIKSRKKRYDSTGEELAHDNYSSSEDELFMEIPQAVQAAQKAEKERICQTQTVQMAHKDRVGQSQLIQTAQKVGNDHGCQILPSDYTKETKKITYEVVSLGAPVIGGRGLTELAKAMKSMQSRVCRRSSVDGYEELDRTPVIVQQETADNHNMEGGSANKIDSQEIEKIIHKSKVVKQLSLSSESSAGGRLNDIQSIRDYEPCLKSVTPDIVCENTVKMKLQRVPSGKSKLYDGQASSKCDTLDADGKAGNRKPIPLPRSYLNNRDSGHESSNDEKSGSSANTSPSCTLYKARNQNTTPIINIAMEQCQVMRENKQNTEVVIQAINGNDTYMNVKMKPRQQTRDRYYENVAIEQVLQNITQRTDSPNPSPIPKRRVRHVSGADSEGSTSSEISLSPNHNKAHLNQPNRQDVSCRYSGGSDCGVRARGDGQYPRPVPAPRYPKEITETHNGKLWYFGKMPRQECETLLLSLAKPCQFLIRDSSHRAGDLMLSVLFGRKVHHYLIQTTQDEKFSIAHHDFNSVAEIIDFYTTHVIMYSGKNDPIYLGEAFIKHQ